MRAISLLVFVGTSVHVASTGWFFTLPEVRSHALRHRGRYVASPALLVLAACALAVVLPEHTAQRLLLLFFGWQLFHFQKQNLGLVALAASSSGRARLTVAERRLLIWLSTWAAVALAARPELLSVRAQGLPPHAFDVAALAFALGLLAGAHAVARRRHEPEVAAALAVSLAFFVPVFVCDRPFAAVAGLTVAHGLQYLLLMGMLASEESRRTDSPTSIAFLVNGAVVGGALLTAASHLHAGAAPQRAAYGAYIGLTLVHFVLDASLWRMRDEFPRELLSRRLPGLVPRV